MTWKHITSFVVVAFVITVTAEAQCNSGCGDDSSGVYTNAGTRAQSLGQGCHRPWTYGQANALWAGYCEEQHVGDEDCGCSLSLRNLLGGRCGGACGGCASGFSLGNGCGDCGGCGTGLNFGQLGLNKRCCGGFLSHRASCDQGSGLLSRLGNGSSCGGCDSKPCFGWKGNAGCGCGPRHGLDLFSGLKSLGCGCGLGSGFGKCDSGCDGQPGILGAGCGCN